MAVLLVSTERERPSEELQPGSKKIDPISYNSMVHFWMCLYVPTVWKLHYYEYPIKNKFNVYILVTTKNKYFGWNNKVGPPKK